MKCNPICSWNLCMIHHNAECGGCAPCLGSYFPDGRSSSWASQCWPSVPIQSNTGRVNITKRKASHSNKIKTSLSSIPHRYIVIVNHFNDTGHAEQHPAPLCRPQAAAPFWVMPEVDLVINNIPTRHFGSYTC